MKSGRRFGEGHDGHCLLDQGGVRFPASPLPDDASAVADLVVVQNWFSELRRLVPTN